MKRYLVSVCKGPDCRRGGADAVFRRAQGELAEQGLTGACTLYRGGCYGLCHLGPNVVVREDVGRAKDPLSREDFQLMGWAGETYYWAMTPERIVRVIERHLKEGQVVAELVGDPSQEPPKDEAG